MKKIIFIIFGFFNGGLERRVTNLSNELGEKGFSVDIVAVNGVSRELFFDLHKNVKIVEVNEKEYSVSYADFSKPLKNEDVLSEKPAFSQSNASVQNRRSLKKRIRKKSFRFGKRALCFIRQTG